jgi:HSP20 family protein
MNGLRLEDRFHSPSEHQSRLLASLEQLPACQLSSAGADWFPPVDVLEDDHEYRFSVDLPGVAREAIQVQVDQEVLTIAGERVVAPERMKRLRSERPAGVFVRRFALPDDASRTEFRIAFIDGILDLHLEKR